MGLVRAQDARGPGARNVDFPLSADCFNSPLLLFHLLSNLLYFIASGLLQPPAVISTALRFGVQFARTPCTLLWSFSAREVLLLPAATNFLHFCFSGLPTPRCLFDLLLYQLSLHRQVSRSLFTSSPSSNLLSPMVYLDTSFSFDVFSSSGHRKSPDHPRKAPYLNLPCF